MEIILELIKFAFHKVMCMDTTGWEVTLGKLWCKYAISTLKFECNRQQIMTKVIQGDCETVMVYVWYMTFGLVHASYSLPEWQAVELTFFAPCFLLDQVKDRLTCHSNF